MSAGSFSGSGNKGGQDFELNLASIIDCFTVLITYLLVSASFITLGTLDISVATPSNDESVQAVPPAVSVSIHLDDGEALRIELSGQEQRMIAIPSREAGRRDLASLQGQLEQLKGRYPELDGAMVTATDSVKYRELVQVVEKTRTVLSKIALSGQGGAE